MTTKDKTETKTELWEKLKASEQGISILRGENVRLRLSADMLKQVLQKCKNCGHRLRLIDFNQQDYIMACDRPICKDYRTPVACISKEQLSSLLGEAREGPIIEVNQGLPKTKKRR